MGARVTHQALLNSLVDNYIVHSGDIREQAAQLVDDYGDLIRERGGVPSSDELRCVFGAVLGKLERRQ